jgi:tetratricopeptide (TPR) repeat protein/DNA-binding XRE family transcriptional regulator
MLAMPDDAVMNGAAKRRRLAQRRKAVGLTQEQLAEEVGVERTTVVRWERGTTEPLPWLQPKLARALQVPTSQLTELLGGPAPAGLDGRGLAVQPVPRQLPAAVAGFTGRAAELGALTRLLDEAGAGAPGTVVISAIGGTAGVGKTALALSWAHQAAGHFPDGQLYVNLRGFYPSGTPASPAAAIRGFLDALGVPPGRIPPSVEAQAGLYRNLVSGKRMLILLDNARDEQQVRPLLPASPCSLVLVTSRSQLGGLAATDGARLLTLDVLSHAEAVQLLTARLGSDRAAGEPAAVDQIASLCACLPLALAVAAARATARLRFPLAALAAELADTSGRLDALDGSDPATSVRAVFSWSCQQLSAESARMFRLLGLHSGPGISVQAAASLAGVPAAQAGHDLAELAGVHLITEHTPGQYSVHDLLHAYAAEQAHAHETESAREAATGRLLGHYLHTARAAEAVIRHPLESEMPESVPPGVVPVVFISARQAWAWFEAQHHTLFAAITLAAETGFDACAWQLPSAMGTFLDRRGRWHEWATAERTALKAATRLGDKTGQASATFLLGLARVRLADYGRAHPDLAESLELYRQLGDLSRQARVHQSLCYVATLQGRRDEALSHAEQALTLSSTTADQAVQAQTLNNLACCHVELGDYQRAQSFCRQAIALCRELGYHLGEAAAWDSLGYTEHHLGRYTQAIGFYQRAIRILRDIGNQPVQALTLARLGDTQHTMGDTNLAHQTWRQALSLLEALHHPDTGKVRAKLGM